MPCTHNVIVAMQSSVRSKEPSEHRAQELVHDVLDLLVLHQVLHYVIACGALCEHRLSHHRVTDGTISSVENLGTCPVGINLRKIQNKLALLYGHA